MRNERGNIITDPTYIERKIRGYYEQLCDNKLESLENKPTPWKIQPNKPEKGRKSENPMSIKENGLVTIINLSINETLYAFTDNFYQTFKIQIIMILYISTWK